MKRHDDAKTCCIITHDHLEWTSTEALGVSQKWTEMVVRAEGQKYQKTVDAFYG